MGEHFNQNTYENALAMLKDTMLFYSFWPEAHDYANYICNHSPMKALAHSTPNEASYGKKPSVTTLCVFDSCCHICILPD